MSKESKRSRMEGAQPASAEPSFADIRAEFSQRVDHYVRLSELADETVSRRVAESIVYQELHERAQIDELERSGHLSKESKRALTATSSNLLRLRKAMGVLAPRRKRAKGFLGVGE